MLTSISGVKSSLERRLRGAVSLTRPDAMNDQAALEEWSQPADESFMTSTGCVEMPKIDQFYACRYVLEIIDAYIGPVGPPKEVSCESTIIANA